MADGVDRHGGSRHDEAPLGADGQRDADGVAAAQHHRRTGLGDAGDELRQRKPRLHRIEQDQQALNGGVFLHGHQLGDDVLIFCGLLALGRFHMALHLPDDSQAVDGVSSPGAVNAAHILDLLFFQPLLLHGDVLLFL